ncbi:hypothetical protein BU23DRAFT_490021, partial [Bimuria novae-zelandiae CBS 107.79]
ILNNAINNNIALKALGAYYSFALQDQRLRCSPYSLNLVGQTIIFRTNKDAFNNNTL